jgi:hypothetical protein
MLRKFSFTYLKVCNSSYTSRKIVIFIVTVSRISNLPAKIISVNYTEMKKEEILMDLVQDCVLLNFGFYYQQEGMQGG